MKNSYKCGMCMNKGTKTLLPPHAALGLGQASVDTCTVCDGAKYFMPGVFKLEADDGMSTIEVPAEWLKHTPYGSIPSSHSLHPHGCEIIPVEITNVIFNDPATIVFWSDNTKTVVKSVNEPFDPEKGLAMAICKKIMGNNIKYYDVFQKWVPEEESRKFQQIKQAMDSIASVFGVTSDIFLGIKEEEK